MAIAGSSTPANLLTMVDGKLTNTPVTTQKDRCVDPQEAVKLLGQGFSAVVKGSDMAQFHDLWRMNNETIA